MKHLFIFFGLLMSVGLSAQTRYYVDAAAGGGSGLSWAQALPSLKQALALTVAGDEVWVASGTYFTHADPATGAPTNNPLSFFNVPSGVHLYGGFNGTETQLSDRNWWQNRATLTTSTSNNPLNYGVRLFAMSGSSNVIIDGFTLEKTYQNQIGAYGNVLSNSNGGDVVVSNCVIRENYVKPGGRGLFQIINGDLEVSNCLVYNNEGGHGAIALTIGSGSSINFRNATIIDNVSTTSINHILSGGVVTYTNSIVWNSGAVPGGGTTYNHCITDFSNGGGSNYNQNPNLTASPEYRPQPGSIAINNGNGSIGLPTLDLHHNNRVIDGQVDIGAIEYENITADFWYSQVAGNLPENPTCPLSDDPVYRPAETSVCRDNGIVAGGDLETLIQSYGLTCDKGFGNTDIKIVRTDVLGNEIFHRVYGTAEDDHLVRVLEHRNGALFALGNTVSESGNQVFILSLDPVTGSITGTVTLDGIKLNNAVKWPGTSDGFLLTGEEDGHAFLIQLLVSGNSYYIAFKGRVPEAESVGNALTVDHSADESQERIIVVGENYGKGGIWSIDLKAGSPSFQSYHPPYDQPFTAILEDEGNFFVGDTAGRIVRFANDFASVAFARTNLNLGGRLHYGHVADLEMWGDHLLAHIAMRSTERDPWLLAINKHTGAIEKNAYVMYTEPSTFALVYYLNQRSNKFDLDHSGALCINTGYYGTSGSSTFPFTYQHRSIFIHRIPQSMSPACSWHPVVAQYYPMAKWKAAPNGVGLLASSPKEVTREWGDAAPVFEGEMLCESYDCDEDLSDIEVLSNHQAATISGSQGFGCAGVLAFDGPSQTMILTTSVPFLSYVWTLPTGEVYTGSTVHLPAGVTRFTLYALDENGCPHYTEYCIRDAGSMGDFSGRKHQWVAEPIAMESSTLQVFPNPSSGLFRLELPAGNFSEIVITNVAGKQVARQLLLGEQQVTVNLEDQPAGVYLLQVEGDQLLTPHKLIKY